MTAHIASFFAVFEAELGNGGNTVRRIKAKRLTQKPPFLEGGEIALKIDVTIPDHAFLRLIPDVSIEIPDGWWTSRPMIVDVQQPPEE